MNLLSLKTSFPIYRRKLNNGLDLIYIKKQNLPVACINLSYKVGSASELRKKSGLAHLFEHLMFTGSENVPKGDFDRLCSLAGGENNAYTTFDNTVYTMTLPRHQLELGFWLESDRMFNFKINQESLDNQKSVVIEEIKETVDNQPYARWHNVMYSSAYSPKSSYSWEIAGSKKDVASVTIDDANDFYQMFYKPANACLTICGDLDENKLNKLVDKYFDKNTNNLTETRKIDFSEKYRYYGKNNSFKDNVPHSAVFIGFHCPGFIDDKVYIADILASIYGTGRSSYLYHSLVYEQQIASDTGVFVEQKENTSLLIFYAFANDEKTTNDMLYDAILNIIKKVKSTGIEKRLLEKASNQLTYGLARELNYASNIADLAGSFAMFFDEPERIYSILDRYNNVSIDNLLNFSDEIIKFDELIRVNVQPKNK